MAKPLASSRKAAKPATEMRLGIFWLVDGKLLIESAPLRECEEYGDHLNYPGSHIDLWAKYLRIGVAPEQSEYEEFPRGRVIHNARSGFTLLADMCLLKNKRVIGNIKRELHLPKRTILDRDPHYRCPMCLYGAHDDE